jgi:hypothetical protein
MAKRVFGRFTFNMPCKQRNQCQRRGSGPRHPLDAPSSEQSLDDEHRHIPRQAVQSLSHAVSRAQPLPSTSPQPVRLSQSHHFTHHGLPPIVLSTWRARPHLANSLPGRLAQILRKLSMDFERVALLPRPATPTSLAFGLSTHLEGSFKVGVDLWAKQTRPWNKETILSI